MKNTSLPRGQAGQAVTEAILILVLLLGFTTIVTSYFKNEEILKKLVTGPFAYMAGMLQNGVWLPPDQGAASHPAGHFRHVVIVGEHVQ